MKNLIFVLMLLSGVMASAAGVVVTPSFGVGAGEYLENNYMEFKAGGAMHFVDSPFAIQLHGFRRFAGEAKDFYGLDLELKLKRQFKLSSQYLFGTYIGPGYRMVSNNFDAPTLDFSLVLSKSQVFSIFLGYKLILLDWMNEDHDNDSLIYLGLQL